MLSIALLCTLCVESIAGGRSGRSTKRKAIGVYRSVKRARVLQQEFMLEPSAYLLVKPEEKKDSGAYSLLRVQEVLVVPCAQKYAQESDSEEELVVGRMPAVTVLAFMQQLEIERQQELRQKQE